MMKSESPTQEATSTNPPGATQPAQGSDETFAALAAEALPPEAQETLEPVGYDFGLKRRSFVQLLGAGLLLAVSAGPALAQRARGRGDARPRIIGARVHLGADGTITVMTGKVEAGQ